MHSQNLKSQSFFEIIKKIFFPIDKGEMRRFLPVAFLMFCILFNQNILRILKDSIIIAEISAEVVSFAKIYCVTPAAAIFLIIYSKMVNILSFEQCYYYLLSFFITFFLIFAFLIYPNVDLFHLSDETINSIILSYPNLKWYIILAGKWSYVLFYVFGELWPNIFYVLLFWQCANSITTTDQAKRFYTLFSLIGNSSVVIVGLLTMHLASKNSMIKSYFFAWDEKILLTQSLMILVLLSSIVSAFLMKYIAANIFIKIDKSEFREKKPSLGLIDSFKYIVKSRYLWLLVICSSAFGLVMNLVESVWRSKIKELYSDVNSYAEFSGMYILWTGVAIIILTIVGNNVMRLYGWFVAAVITPIVMIISGSLFFILVVFDQYTLSFLDSITIISPLALAILVGAIQNVVAKGAKYSIWDAATQMLYIPLDVELKTKGKAAVDVISAKTGKSLSALIQIILFTVFPAATYDSIAPILMVIFISVCLVWIYSVKEIHKDYIELIK
jgi:AAA family ATP:ADP antiporter